MMAEDSYASFAADEYLRTFARGSEVSEFCMKHLARFYLAAASSGLKILDYGCGPCLAYSISAASKASEIVLADYSKPNRDSLQKWLDGDVSGFDWTPSFQYVVKTLEGGTEEDAKQREHDLRSKVKAVIQCDLLKDEFIDARYNDVYDIVMCFLCLDSAVRDNDSYISGIAKLSSLIKQGGHLLLYSTLRENCAYDEGYYIVGGVKYHNIVLKRGFIIETLRKKGFIIEAEDSFLVSTKSKIKSNSDGFIFFDARKS